MAWLCPKAYAPIYGTYPGLASLIQEADVIAGVTILKQLSNEDLGGSARYKIEFAKVLKGSPPKKQAVASLRNHQIIRWAQSEHSPPPQRPAQQHHQISRLDLTRDEVIPLSKRALLALHASKYAVSDP
jgi:hypothetical protein